MFTYEIHAHLAGKREFHIGDFASDQEAINFGHNKYPFYYLKIVKHDKQDDIVVRRDPGFKGLY